MTAKHVKHTIKKGVKKGKGKAKGKGKISKKNFPKFWTALAAVFSKYKRPVPKGFQKKLEAKVTK